MKIMFDDERSAFSLNLGLGYISPSPHEKVGVAGAGHSMMLRLKSHESTSLSLLSTKEYQSCVKKMSAL